MPVLPNEEPAAPSPTAEVAPHTPPRRSPTNIAAAVLQLTGKKQYLKDVASLKAIKIETLKKIYTQGTGLPAPAKVPAGLGHKSMNRFLGDLMAQSNLFQFSTDEEISTRRAFAARKAADAHVHQMTQKRIKRKNTDTAVNQANKPHVSRFPSLDNVASDHTELEEATGVAGAQRREAGTHPSAIASARGVSMRQTASKRGAPTASKFPYLDDESASSDKTVAESSNANGREDPEASNTQPPKELRRRNRRAPGPAGRARTTLSLPAGQPQALREYLSNAELKLPSQARFPDTSLPNIKKAEMRTFVSQSAKELKGDLEEVPGTKSDNECLNVNFHVFARSLSLIAGRRVVLFCKKEEREANGSNEVYSQLQSSLFKKRPVHKLILSYVDGDFEVLVFALLNRPKGKWLDLNGPGFDLESAIAWRKANNIDPWSEAFVCKHILLVLIQWILEAQSHGLIAVDIKPQNIANLRNDSTDIVLLDIGLFPMDESPIYHTYTLAWVNVSQLLGCTVDASISLHSIALVALKTLRLELPIQASRKSSPEEVARSVLRFREDLPKYFLEITRAETRRVSEPLAAFLCHILYGATLDIETAETLVLNLCQAKSSNQMIAITERWRMAGEQYESSQKVLEDQREMRVGLEEINRKLEATIHRPRGEQMFEEVFQRATNREEAKDFKIAFQTALVEATKENKRLTQEVANLKTQANPSRESTKAAGELTVLKRDLDQTRQELTTTKTALDAALRTIETKDSEITELEKKITVLRKKVQALALSDM